MHAEPDALPREQPDRERRRGILAAALGALLVAATALVAYSNATPAVAIHDDSFFVPARHDLSSDSVARMFGEDMWASTGSPTGVYRPLTLLSIAVDGSFHGKDPRGYHATNVGLHALASVCVYLLLLALLGRGHAATCTLAAMLFAVHPVHAEAVNSVYNRSDMLVTTLVTLALLLVHQLAHRRAMVAWVGAALLYLAALLCRESAVSLPLLAALLLWFAHPLEPARRRLQRAMPAALLALPLALYFVLRHHALADSAPTSGPALGVDAGQDLASRALYSLAALREYARMMVLPWPLRVSWEDFRGDGLASALAVHGLLVATAWRCRQRLPLLSFSIAAFYATLLPSTRLFTSSGMTLQIGGFVLLKPQAGLVLVAERVAYLPSMAFTVGVAVLGREAARRQGQAAVAVALLSLVAAFTLITRTRNEAWHDAVSLFTAEVAAAPSNGDGWRLLVSALSTAGRMREAASACDGQVGLPDRSAQLLNNCGIVYDKLGRPEDAMAAYRRAIDAGLAPVAHANLARLLSRLGREAEARAEFEASVQSETNPAQQHLRRGRLLMRYEPERRDEARREFEAALQAQPGFAAAQAALDELGR